MRDGKEMIIQIRSRMYSMQNTVRESVKDREMDKQRYSKSYWRCMELIRQPLIYLLHVSTFFVFKQEYFSQGSNVHSYYLNEDLCNRHAMTFQVMGLFQQPTRIILTSSYKCPLIHIRMLSPRMEMDLEWNCLNPPSWNALPNRRIRHLVSQLVPAPFSLPCLCL